MANEIETSLKNIKSRINLNHNIYNHNYIKILESDWSSAGLISAVIGQLYASCLSNWTVRVIELALVALEWLFFSARSLEVEYINRSNSLNHCHILLEFCYSYN